MDRHQASRHPDDDVPPPPLPRVDLRRVFHARREIFAALWTPFHEDDAVSRDGFRAMVYDLHRLLGPRGVAYDVVVESCRPVLGALASDATFWELAWRLAANLAGMKAGTPAWPWTHQARPEWVPFQVTSALRLSRSGRGGAVRRGCEYGFQSLAGSYCPGTITRWWSRDQYSLLARELGFTRRDGKHPLEHAYQLVGLRLFGLLTPHQCRHGHAAFYKVACVPSMVAYNRGVLRRRYRDEPCPFGHGHECHQCPVGYLGTDGVDACKSATHAHEYLAAACPACGRGDAPFDDSVSPTICVDCTIRARLHPEER